MDFERMLRYCADLEKNNERPWFHAHHDEYEAAKADFTELVDRLKFCVAERAGDELGERILFSDPKSMLYRIPRDARVHKNQPPYNPSFRARIAADRKVLLPLGYYIRIAPGSSLFGTGAWCPEPELLPRARNYIAGHWEEFQAILLENGLELTGDKLKRVPAGFDPEHPAAEYLKHKEWDVICPLRDEELTDFDRFVDRIGGEVERMEPFRVFMTRALREKVDSPWDIYRF
ncbi:MAG: DUF2461 domain-containing protein [Oscillospiraceae bacterium]